MSVRRLILLSTGVSAAGAYVLLSLTARSNGWWDRVTLIGFYAGTLASGNIHAPNELAVWVTVWLLLFIPVLCSALMLAHIHRWSRSRARRR